MKTISIVVYEDNESYRSYLCSLFEFDPSISLKDAFGNCNNCVEEIRTLEPDVVLMDLRMPNSNDGLDGLKKLKDAFPELRIIMLTDSDYPDDIFSCRCL